MAGKFKFKVPFPKKKKVHDSAATSLNIDLPSFEEQELTDIEEIGRGTFGSIFKANKDGKTVVVKRCLAKEPEEKALVLKEARLLSKLKGHENIVKFHGFNHSRSSILIEYVEFTFEFLDIEHSPVHNLRELLRECDSISDFENFEHLNHYVMHDIILGLSFLHKENIVHRDLKPENVLISNQHFVDDGEIAKQWTTKPVIAKLTDFGEARSDLIQTMQVSENTKNINRGTPAYMAPECILHTIQGANQNDLKKMDIWSLGMVAHAMCNPDSRHPYKKEIDDSPVLNKRDVLERLLEKKEKPSSLPKYEDMRRKHWGAIMGVFDLCINFEPNERPNMDEVMRMFVVRCVSIEQLMVSQASISEMLDEAMALGANNVCRDRETLNACTFIALLTSETLLCNRNASMASAAQEVMLNFPKSVNRARSHDQCYSAHEALEVLENCKAMKEVNLEIPSILGTKS